MKKNTLYQTSPVGDILMLPDRQQVSFVIDKVNARNYRLICRYYCFTVLMNIKSGHAIKYLVEEFNIKEKLVSKIIDSRKLELKKLDDIKPTILWFKEKYERINWDYNPAEEGEQ